MNKRWLLALIILSSIVFLILYSNKFILAGQPAIESKEIIRVATTTSTYDSGLLQTLIPVFEDLYPEQVKVDVISVGTGQALALGRDGNADLLIVHARSLEDQFMEQGFGEKAYDLMSNQFVLVGPPSDPAQLSDAKSIADAFQRIAFTESVFISRGDESGTHVKELSLWELSNIKDLNKPWYLSIGQGMGATLQMASEKEAYTLADQATYLTSPYNLVVHYQGDLELLNPYGLILVQDSLQREWAERLINFMLGEEGQALIGSYGIDQYGQPLFIPQAKIR